MNTQKTREREREKEREGKRERESGRFGYRTFIASDRN